MRSGVPVSGRKGERVTAQSGVGGRGDQAAATLAGLPGLPRCRRVGGVCSPARRRVVARFEPFDPVCA